MNIRPKKRLGQNFLVDKNIQRKIINACDFKDSDTVLEIGSGRGELTTLIAERVNKIFALEIDPYLCESLKNNLKDFLSAQVIRQDVLKFNLKKYFCRAKQRIRVFGNIPYYISSPIIEHLIKFRDKISDIFITVQKEFALRMIASPGSKKYGSFTIFTQYYTEPKIVFVIKKNSFYPVPKVDSILLNIKIRQNPAINVKDEKLFFKITRGAFNQRRKTLRNSLLGIISAQSLEQFFDKYNISKHSRPETLSLQDFANL
ncbi:MAG: 16S rRNA (adenine(1518)-N(6)/adenine(1519)-N(6))-dimethyltransferase RsmA, partial [Candidatus Omnitrophota bacterium]|nr:16S rRNA (adenine(1518)-N(6)/adenine(1519)-N(6))-dimethyltransferase RsmA [Candidatus Omnitrophota bacterium]